MKRRRINQRLRRQWMVKQLGRERAARLLRMRVVMAELERSLPTDVQERIKKLTNVRLPEKRNWRIGGEK